MGLYERYRDCAETLDEGRLRRAYEALFVSEHDGMTFDDFKIGHILAEIRTRDPLWLSKGIVPAVEYQSNRAKHEFSPYERELASILCEHGFGSYVLERSNVPGSKTADVMLNKVRCDFKRPKGRGFNTIDGLVRDAGKKANMIVFYLEPGVSTATKEQIIAHFENCGIRRGIRNALVVDYDRSLTRVKL